MAELFIVGHGIATLNDTVYAVDQNNSTSNFTTSGHQFGKTCYNDFIYFMLYILIFTLHINHYIIYHISKFVFYFFREKYHQTEWNISCRTNQNRWTPACNILDLFGTVCVFVCMALFHFSKKNSAQDSTPLSCSKESR